MRQVRCSLTFLSRAGAASHIWPRTAAAGGARRGGRGSAWGAAAHRECSVPALRCHPPCQCCGRQLVFEHTAPPSTRVNAVRPRLTPHTAAALALVSQEYRGHGQPMLDMSVAMFQVGYFCQIPRDALHTSNSFSIGARLLFFREPCPAGNVL